MAEEKKPSSESGEKKPKSSSSGTTHKTEQPVMVDTVGVDIRKLLARSSGKEFDDMTTEDFKTFAESKGVVGRDVKRMTKAFNSIKKNSARQYLIDTDGFNVFEENLPLTKSGRDIGNKKGLDLGDLVGSGRDVSLLAGFASRELSNYRKHAEKMSAVEMTKPDTSQLTSLNPKAKIPSGGLTVAGLANNKSAPAGKGSAPKKGGSTASSEPATPARKVAGPPNVRIEIDSSKTPKGNGTKKIEAGPHPTSDEAFKDFLMNGPKFLRGGDSSEEMEARRAERGKAISEAWNDIQKSFQEWWDKPKNERAARAAEKADKPKSERPKSKRTGRDHPSSSVKGPGIQLSIHK